MKKYIAFEGKKYTIEWYFNQNNNSNAKEYFNELEKEEKASLFALFKLFDELGQLKNKNKFNYEGDSIYAFKPIPDRFLCFFFEGNKIIITNAFRKKKQKLPANEKQKALNAKSDYEDRVKEGNYYDNK
jgi:phage-related protein